jgi:hypothetical protein
MASSQDVPTFLEFSFAKGKIVVSAPTSLAVMSWRQWAATSEAVCATQASFPVAIDADLSCLA